MYNGYIQELVNGIILHKYILPCLNWLILAFNNVLVLNQFLANKGCRIPIKDRYRYFYQHWCRYRYGLIRYRYDQNRYRYISIGIGKKNWTTNILVYLYLHIIVFENILRKLKTMILYCFIGNSPNNETWEQKDLLIVHFSGEYQNDGSR